MRLTIAFLSLLALSTSALAYEEGTITCKNAVEGLPDNTYKIENVTMGGAVLPYLEIHRYFRTEEGNPPQHTTIRGIATVSSSDLGARSTETLSLAAIRLEFSEGRLSNCRQ